MSADDELRMRVNTDHPERYLRSPSGTLHLRREYWTANEHDNPGEGLSETYARCGWENDLGALAIPARLFPDAEYRLCKRCAVIEP